MSRSSWKALHWAGSRDSSRPSVGSQRAHARRCVVPPVLRVAGTCQWQFKDRRVERSWRYCFSRTFAVRKATVRSYIRLEASIIWSSFNQGRVQFPFRICYFAFLLCASPDGSRDSTNPPLCVPLNNSIVCNLPASCRFSTKPRMVA